MLFFPLLKVITPVPEIPQEVYNKPLILCHILFHLQSTSVTEYLAPPVGHKRRNPTGRFGHWWHREATECCFLAFVSLPSLLGQRARIPLRRQTCWAGVRLITTWHIFCLHHTPPTQQESAESSRHDQATAFGLLNLTVERCASHAISCLLLSRRHYRENS